MIDPAAVLALIGDLYTQLSKAQQELATLRAENEQLRSAQPPAPS